MILSEQNGLLKDWQNYSNNEKSTIWFTQKHLKLVDSEGDHLMTAEVEPWKRLSDLSTQQAEVFMAVWQSYDCSHVVS